MKQILLIGLLILGTTASQSWANDVAPASASKTELKNDKAAMCNTPAGMHNKACANMPEATPEAMAAPADNARQ